MIYHIIDISLRALILWFIQESQYAPDLTMIRTTVKSLWIEYRSGIFFYLPPHLNKDKVPVSFDLTSFLSRSTQGLVFFNCFKLLSPLLLDHINSGLKIFSTRILFNLQKLVRQSHNLYLKTRLRAFNIWHSIEQIYEKRMPFHKREEERLRQEQEQYIQGCNLSRKTRSLTRQKQAHEKSMPFF